jgi:hypothetical protein
MDKTQAPSPHPALLEPGTVVGPWRVVAWASRGVHGAVYQAVRGGHELAEPVALKLALLPKDPHFAREHLRSVIVPPALFEVELRLRSFIVRLLSVRPEKRGTAAQLVQALEHVSELCLTDSPPPLPAPPPPARRSWLATTAAVLALAAWVWWLTPGAPVQRPSIVHRGAGSASQKDGGTSGLGEAASTTSAEDSPRLFMQEGMAEDPLPEPEPGQATPDAKGRCPHKGQVALNDGCWGRVNVEHDKCEELSGQMFKGTCYVPVFPPGRRQSTSHPSRKE